MSAPSPLSGPETWNLVSEGYSEELLPLFSEYAADALERGRVTPESTVLDVATGPGTLALLAAAKVKRVVAIDFATDMLEIARRRAGEAGADNIEFHLADGQDLPVESGTFDAAFSMFGLMFFPDRAAGLGEMVRALRPGGRGVISSWTPVEESPLLVTLFGALREALPELPFGRGDGPLSSSDAVRDEMTAAGFSDVRVDRVIHPLKVLSAGEFWGSQVRSSAPIALVKSRLSAGEWDRFSGRVLARLESELGTGSVELGWTAFLGIGTK